MARYGTNHKGGRPKGPATVERERVKAYIAERIAQDIAPMVDALIKKVKKGDAYAFDKLTDRGFGKATQPISNEDGVPFVLQLASDIAKKNESNGSSKQNS